MGPFSFARKTVYYHKKASIIISSARTKRLVAYKYNMGRAKDEVIL